MLDEAQLTVPARHPALQPHPQQGRNEQEQQACHQQQRNADHQQPLHHLGPPEGQQAFKPVQAAAEHLPGLRRGGKVAAPQVGEVTCPVERAGLPMHLHRHGGRHALEGGVQVLPGQQVRGRGQQGGVGRGQVPTQPVLGQQAGFEKAVALGECRGALQHGQVHAGRGQQGPHPGRLGRGDHEHRVHVVTDQGIARGGTAQGRPSNLVQADALLREQALKQHAVPAALRPGRHLQTGQTLQRGERRVAAEQPQTFDVHTGQGLHPVKAFGLPRLGRPAETALHKGQVRLRGTVAKALQILLRAVRGFDGQRDAVTGKGLGVTVGEEPVGAVGLAAADREPRIGHGVQPDPGQAGQRRRHQSHRQADHQPAMAVQGGGVHAESIRNVVAL